MILIAFYISPFDNLCDLFFEALLVFSDLQLLIALVKVGGPEALAFVQAMSTIHLRSGVFFVLKLSVL
jgi:ABC-type dipeptide/oligopeptide/nickel transport system permease subunit